MGWNIFPTQDKSRGALVAYAFRVILCIYAHFQPSSISDYIFLLVELPKRKIYAIFFSESAFFESFREKMS